MSQSLKIPELRHCLDCIQETVSFFNYSAKRVLCLDKVVKLRAPKSKRTRLVTLCSTRFVERHTAVLVFRELLSFIVEALQGMSAWESSVTRKNASQLLHSLLTPQFIVALLILESVTGLMQPVSQHLQKVGNDLIAALQNVDNLVAVLSQWWNRATAKFAELFQLAEELCQKLDVNLTAPRVVGKSQYRSNAGANSSQTAEEFYRVNVFIPLLETISNDILSRFSAYQRQSFSLAGLVPSRLTVLNDVKSAVEK